MGFDMVRQLASCNTRNRDGAPDRIGWAPLSLRAARHLASLLTPRLIIQDILSYMYGQTVTVDQKIGPFPYLYILN
jgi:hypothetical protein